MAERERGRDTQTRQMRQIAVKKFKGKYKTKHFWSGVDGGVSIGDGVGESEMEGGSHSLHHSIK